MKINKKYKISLIILLSVSLVSFIVLLKNTQATPQPNVILITIDALRVDHLGLYGYKRNTTPNIDKLAKDGVIFTQAISQASFTPPSIYSILTSTYPRIHGVYDFGVAMNRGLITLPEILKDRGYYLGLISGRGLILEFNFPELEEIFDTYIPSNTRIIFAEQVTRNAAEWLRLNRKKRFFLWLHYIDPHTPYRPPPPYNKLYVNDEFADENNRLIPIANESTHPFKALLLDDGYKAIPRVTAVKGITDINYYISQYDGEISYVDSQLGILFTELKRLNLYDNTLIVITSDHGESIGEHDFWFVHGNNLYDELLKVPLIMRYRSIGRSKRIDRQVQSIDIMPTILDIAKIEIPKEARGVTLFPLIRKGQYYVKYAFSERPPGYTSIRTANWKLIHYDIENQYELYNLEDDPEESKNLVDIEKTQTQSLKNELHSWIEKIPSITTQKKVLDEETKERLRSLGYIQ